MSEQTLDVAEELPPLPLEVKLVGWLLIVWGVIGALTTSEAINRLIYRPFPDIYNFMMLGADILYCLLELVGIAVGIGLLQFAGWARRTGIVLLLCWIVYHLVPFLISVLMPGHPGLHLDVIISVLREIVPDAALILALEMPVVRTIWEEGRPPGVLAGLARKLAECLPPATPAVLAVVGILLCELGVADLIDGWASAHQSRFIPLAGYSGWELLMHYRTFLYGIAFSLAGLGLILHKNWARMLAVIIMVVTLVDWHVLSIVRIPHLYSSPSYIVVRILSHLSWILIYALFIVLTMLAWEAKRTLQVPSATQDPLESDLLCDQQG